MKFWTRIKRPRAAQLVNARGMTLIEIMIVITIMASIMGVVGVYVVGALEEANIKEASIQMGHIKQNLDMYYTQSDPHEYPDQLQGLVDRKIMKEIPEDPWGEQYIYRTSGGRQYTLKSKGPDATEGGGDDINSDGAGSGADPEG